MCNVLELEPDEKNPLSESALIIRGIGIPIQQVYDSICLVICQCTILKIKSRTSYLLVRYFRDVTSNTQNSARLVIRFSFGDERTEAHR